ASRARGPWFDPGCAHSRLRYCTESAWLSRAGSAKRAGFGSSAPPRAPWESRQVGQRFSAEALARRLVEQRFATETPAGLFATPLGSSIGDSLRPLAGA